MAAIIFLMLLFLKKLLQKRNLNHLVNSQHELFTAGRNKRVYTTQEFGYPYLSNSDVTAQSPFSNCKYNSKKYGFESAALLKERMIVTGRVGAIGQTAYITKEFEELQAMGSDNIIRIVPKDINTSGFLYAYLTSKIGNTFLWKYATGGVQPYINEEMVGAIPVPIFPPDKQQQIHELIAQSAKLRVEANKLLEESVKLFENSLPSIQSDQVYITSVRRLFNNNLRIDATTNYTNIQTFYQSVSKTHTLLTIKEVAENVFTPNIFKRIRVDNSTSGVPFLSGSDLLNSLPSFNSFLSKKMKNINDYILKKGWIAIQDAGTIGYVSLINGYLDGVAATNNLVRIIPKEGKNSNPYIYAFLKTKQGQAILRSYEYGSVQKHIDNNQVSSILVPILPEYDIITGKVSDYLDKVTEACYKESQAIQLVEKEIEQWQQ